MRRPSATSESVPKRPTVKAMEPNAPSGATHMTKPTMRKNTSRTLSITAVTAAPRSPQAASPAANSTETSSTGSTSVCAKASTKVVGNEVEQELRDALRMGPGGVLADRLDIKRTGRHMHAGPGLEHIHGGQRQHQRQRGDGFEVDQRLQGDAPDPAHVVHGRHTVHHGAEDHRRDEHADQRNEGVPQRLHVGPQLRPPMAERDARPGSPAVPAPTVVLTAPCQLPSYCLGASSSGRGGSHGTAENRTSPAVHSAATRRTPARPAETQVTEPGAGFHVSRHRHPRELHEGARAAVAAGQLRDRPIRQRYCCSHCNPAVPAAGTGSPRRKAPPKTLPAGPPGATRSTPRQASHADQPGSSDRRAWRMTSASACACTSHTSQHTGSAGVGVRTRSRVRLSERRWPPRHPGARWPRAPPRRKSP